MPFYSRACDALSDERLAMSWFKGTKWEPKRDYTFERRKCGIV